MTNSRVLRLLVLPLAAGLLLSGCGSAAEPVAKSGTPPSSAEPAAKVAQPKSSKAVTVQVLNWDAYSSGGALLTWKRMFEAVQASVAAKRFLPGALDSMTDAVQDQFYPGMEQAWQNNWTVPAVTKVRVEKARLGARRAELTMCLWTPSYNFRKPSGEVVGPLTRVWQREVASLKWVDDRWIIEKVLFPEGKAAICPGKAPK